MNPLAESTTAEVYWELAREIPQSGGLLSLRILASAFNMDEEAQRNLQIDRPDLWKSGFLQVVPLWRDTRERWRENERGRSDWVLTVIEALENLCVLVPNRAGMNMWAVSTFDDVSRAVRPIVFSPTDYIGTFRPALKCYPDEDGCIVELCRGRCVRYEGYDVSLGGNHIGCRCRDD